ncbi:MAG: hypothetical protein ACRYGG_00390 [Janthinobacterium lividum]
MMHVVDNVLDEVDSILKKSFDKQLFSVKEDDKVRLLKLKMWSVRYKVSIKYILEKLIPHFEKYGNKSRGKAGTSKGLGTTIPILTGPSAEALLVENIKRDYPDNENVLSWRQRTQLEFIGLVQVDEDELVTKQPKGILQYNSVSDYRKAYEARIQRTRKTEEKIVKSISRQPFRNNPWR